MGEHRRLTDAEIDEGLRLSDEDNTSRATFDHAVAYYHTALSELRELRTKLTKLRGELVRSSGRGRRRCPVRIETRACGRGRS